MTKKKQKKSVITKSVNASRESADSLKLINNEGEVSEDVIECRDRLVNNTKLNFAREKHWGNKSSRENLNEVAVPIREEL